MEFEIYFSDKYVFIIISQSEKSGDPYMRLITTCKSGFHGFPNLGEHIAKYMDFLIWESKNLYSQHFSLTPK